ncbi:MAG TPA: DUF3667 domain-containing protein [Rhizomicrobium sp.]|jgi:hypothetical protein
MPDDFGAIAELGGAAAVELAASTLVARGAKTDKCHNCGAPTFAAYCAVCGQERDTHRRSLWGLAHDFVAEIVSFDSRVLRTVIALLVQPGELPLAFREGRTRRYMPAVRLYLFVSLLFFLVLSITGIALFQIELREIPNAYVVRTTPNGRISIVANGHGGAPIPAVVGGALKAKRLSPGPHSGIATRVHFFGRIGEFHQSITPEGWANIAEIKADVLRAVGNDPHGWMAKNAVAMIEKLARDPAALNAPLTAWIPRVFFLLLPIFALLLAGFYIRQRRKFYFVDHLVFSLSIHSFVFAVLILAIGAAQVLAGGTVAKLIFAAMALYLFVAMKRFYAQGWLITALKFLSLSFMYVVFVLLPVLIMLLVTGFIEG